MRKWSLSIASVGFVAVILGLLATSINLYADQVKPTPRRQQTITTERSTPIPIEELVRSKLFMLSDLPDPVQTPKKSEGSVPKDLADTYTLIGTVLTNGLHIALMQDESANQRKLLSTGDHLDDCTLEEISSTSARFQCQNDDQVYLHMKTDIPASSKSP